nr:restriction endonuclease [uncultured Flavobacterium sp.]
MSNNGKSLEKTIHLVEETFKNSVSTQIFRNHKIKNLDGEKREIDILIKTNINGYDLCIAIECKDYKGKVPVDKIEAFNSKCLSIKEINKMIFISSNGFQSGAITSAKRFNIDLLTAEQLTSNIFKTLIPIRQLNIKILPTFENRTISLNGDNINQDIINSVEKTFTGIIKDTKTNKSIHIDDAFAIGIKAQQREIQNMAMINWMDLKDKNIDEIIIPIGYDIIFTDYHVEDTEGNKVQLLKGSCDVEVQLTYKFLEATGRIIKNLDETEKAKSINIKMGDKTESEFIIKPNEEVNIYLTENENTIKLETLYTYNTKTKEIKIP